MQATLLVGFPKPKFSIHKCLSLRSARPHFADPVDETLDSPLYRR
jgi:hypothetical protein